MLQLAAAQRDDGPEALGGGAIVLAAMLPEKALHQPRLGMVRIDLENAIEKDLCCVPTFLCDGSRSVSPIDPDDVFLFGIPWPRWLDPESLHLSTRIVLVLGLDVKLLTRQR